MVFLSLPCWIRSRGPDRYWKVQELLKHARVGLRLLPEMEGAKCCNIYIHFLMVDMLFTLQNR